MNVTVYDKKLKGDKILGGISIKLNASKIVSRFADKWFSLKKGNNCAGEIRLQLHFIGNGDLNDPSKNSLDIFDKNVENTLTLSEQKLVDYLSAIQGNTLLPF